MYLSFLSLSLFYPSGGSGTLATTLLACSKDPEFPKSEWICILVEREQKNIQLMCNRLGDWKNLPGPVDECQRVSLPTFSYHFKNKFALEEVDDDEDEEENKKGKTSKPRRKKQRNQYEDDGLAPADYDPEEEEKKARAKIKKRKSTEVVNVLRFYF